LFQTPPPDASGKKGRIAMDFRKLNYLTIGDSFPIPVISEMLNSLGNSKYFLTIDCASGFWQIPLRAQDRPKTVFNTEYYQFEYTYIYIYIYIYAFWSQRSPGYLSAFNVHRFVWNARFEVSSVFR
jgi:hypothetical protein